MNALKRSVLDLLLTHANTLPKNEGHVHVVFVLDYPGVKVPRQVHEAADQDSSKLRLGSLKFSYRYEPRDLAVTPTHLVQTLNFGTEQHRCLVPLAAILAAGTTDGAQTAWAVEVHESAEAPAPAEPTKPTRPTHLRAI